MRFGQFLAELWRTRELVRTLAERDLRARYKQATLGFAWSVLTPLALLVVFTIVFQRVARIDTGDVPYPLFAYLGLLPWTFFSSALTLGSNSLVSNAPLLNKVYCPREVFPLAGVAVAAVDTALSGVAMALLFVVYTFVPRGAMVWLLPVILVQLTFTMAVVLILSGVLVYLRDLRHALPILLQLGLFATPVAYGLDRVPQSYRILYSILNPLAPVIDGYRRAILYGLRPQWSLLAVGAASSIMLLLGGYILFKRLETGFADVV